MHGLDWWAGVDWWIGGLAEWKLAAWSLEGLQVKSSTRDRDGSADNDENDNDKDDENDNDNDDEDDNDDNDEYLMMLLCSSILDLSLRSI